MNIYTNYKYIDRSDNHTISLMEKEVIPPGDPDSLPPNDEVKVDKESFYLYMDENGVPNITIYDRAGMENAINKVICAPYKVKHCDDVMLYDLYDPSVWDTVYKLKILPQRVGIAWEVAATYCGWKKCTENGLDLVREKTKEVLELKNSASSDNSSSRRHKYNSLLEFKKTHPNYKLYYAIINDKTPKRKMVDDNKIYYVSGVHALRLLYNNQYKVVWEAIKKSVVRFNHTTGLDDVKCK